MWVYTVVLQGHAADDKRTMRFRLIANHATLDLAVADTATIKAALAALTKAFIAKEALSYTISEDNQVVADESADCFEELAISAYLNDQDVAQKLTVLAVPAPEDAVFMSDNQTLDTSNALVRAYVDAIEATVEVSDGEALVSDGRTNGAINKGWKRSRAKSFKA
jgi:hypothetical protein